MTRVDVSRLASASGQTFPEDYVALTARRLAISAGIAALIHLIYIVLYQTAWASAANPVALAASIVGLIMSLVAAYLSASASSARRVTVVAVAYEIVFAFSLAISEAATVSYTRPSSQTAWTAVVIVLFPFLIPASPRVVLAASLASAAMTPFAMAVVFGLAHRPWPAPSVSLSFILPPLACAFLAWAPTNAIHRLSTAVQRARQLGSYELGERLGSGGMGEVWLARHRLLARPAVVKLIKPEMLGAKDEASRQLILARFEKEAKVTAHLESPHTVELYDFGISSRGELFIVMELLAGVDMQTLIERFGPLPSERVAYLLLQACDSLEDAHRRGLVHRDIKPANLFVSRKGVEYDVVKVLDFGLVKRWQSDEPAASVSLSQLADAGQTAFGQIVGTPAFIAPEAAIGQDAVDHRADLYSLGCVAYWLLTGHLVFEDPTALGMVAAHVAREPPAPSSRVESPISPELEAITLRCLAKERSARPASARQLRELLSMVRFSEPWSRERAATWWQENLRELVASPRATEERQARASESLSL